MTRKFKLLFIALLTLPVALHAEEITKKLHRAYAKSQIAALDMVSKFGNIEIRDEGGDSVTVDARVTVKDVSGTKARQLLDMIGISIRKNGNLLEVETIIQEKFKTGGNFNIDYRINIPKDRDLTINQKFGNVVLADRTGKGSFTIAYGNLTAGNLNNPASSPLWLDLSYGKADIGSMNQLKAIVKYSKVFAGTAGKVELESKYSGLDIKRTGDLQLNSKYDGIRLGEISGLTATSKYTNYTIEKLNRYIILDTEYGSVRIDEVSPEFTKVEINNSYGGINIGMSNLDYYLDASCNYCDVKYPAERFRGNRSKENQNTEVKGNVGNASSGKTVLLRSRYGSINLTR